MPSLAVTLLSSFLPSLHVPLSEIVRDQCKQNMYCFWDLSSLTDILFNVASTKEYQRKKKSIFFFLQIK